MGRPRGRLDRTARCSALALVAAAPLAAGCSAGQSPPDDDTRPGTGSAALRVETVWGADRISETTRTDVEGTVGDVLSNYVVEAFLDDFPRQEFVQSFEDFTSGAARAAARDIDLLTAASVRDATDVRATTLDADLSFVARGGTVHAGTATVHLAFEATFEDGSTQPLALDGRLLFAAEGQTWSIFGYDVAFDDGDGQPAEAVFLP